MACHTNSWDGISSRRYPCPRCLPGVKINETKMPKSLNGVLRIVGQVVSTGKYLYACYSCSYEEER